jgi:hypothetical protein
MLHGRWFTVAATASLLVAGGFVGSLVAAAEAPAMAANCGEAADITVLPSPFAPWKGAPLRVMVVAEKPLDGALSLTAPDAGSAWRRALFLVRRGRDAGRRDLARHAGVGRLRSDQPRNRREREQAGSRVDTGGKDLAGAQ